MNEERSSLYMHTICVTGHRPKRLYGYDLTDPRWMKLYEKFQEILTKKNCDWAVSGMALGVDTIFALAVIDLRDNKGVNIKLHCAVPCHNQSEPWFNEEDISRYNQIIEQSDRVTYVTNSDYVDGCLEERNKFMVDISDEVLAVWTGEAGGTAHCIEYAEHEGRKVTNLIDERGEIVYD
jgi:uncharacterized phage-like protein YoqJ